MHQAVIWESDIQADVQRSAKVSCMPKHPRVHTSIQQGQSLVSQERAFCCTSGRIQNHLIHSESGCVSAACDSYFLQDRLPRLPEPTVLSRSVSAYQVQGAALNTAHDGAENGSVTVLVGTEKEAGSRRCRQQSTWRFQVRIHPHGPNPKPSPAFLTSLYKWQEKFQRDLLL